MSKENKISTKLQFLTQNSLNKEFILIFAFRIRSEYEMHGKELKEEEKFHQI